MQSLDEYFDTYRKSSPYDDFMRISTFEIFEPFIINKSFDALELGCGDGLMTERIARHAKSLDVVDGSIRFLSEAQNRRISNAKFHHSLFDEYQTDKKYDVIFATYILTHIPNLFDFFYAIKRLLKPNGYLFISVPNARALSRQLALHMGFIDDLFSLSENDKNHGHCRSYDRVRLNADITANGFFILSQGGIILKPLADFQMDELIKLEILKAEQLKGLLNLGLEYPDLSAAIFSICKLKEK